MNTLKSIIQHNFQLKIAVATTQGSDDEPKLFLNNCTLSLCKINEGFFGSFLAKTIFLEQNEYSNFTFECPYVKGLYYIKNFPISDRYIPSQMKSFLPKKVTLKLIVKFLAKMKQKKMKHLIELADIVVFAVFTQ